MSSCILGQLLQNAGVTLFFIKKMSECGAVFCRKHYCTVRIYHKYELFSKKIVGLFTGQIWLKCNLIHIECVWKLIETKIALNECYWLKHYQCTEMLANIYGCNLGKIQMSFNIESRQNVKNKCGTQNVTNFALSCSYIIIDITTKIMIINSI